MRMSLDPAGETVRVGSVRLRTPRLVGEAEAVDLEQSTRGLAVVSDEFDRALSAEGLIPQDAVEVRIDEEISGAGDSRGEVQERLIEVEVAAPAKGWGQAVVTRDEGGVITWSFSPPDGADTDASRSEHTRTYQIRAAVPPTGDEAQDRGLVGRLATKLIKVVVFRLADELLAKAGHAFALSWENKHRPYNLRSMSPRSFRQPSDEPPNWNQLETGRSLLLLHGTLMQSHTEFGRLDPEYIRHLYARYEGRVWAFDFPTLSVDPAENLRALFERMPTGRHFEADVISVSRGGLVARLITERADVSASLGRLTLRNVVFVAVPNSGTTLASPDRWSTLVDAFTNIVNLFPDNPVGDTIAVVATIAKMLAVGIFDGLDGLSAMEPGGDFLRGLNHGDRCESQYFGVSSNFEPTNPALAMWARDTLVDAVFSGKGNDLIVPTTGVYETNGAGSFPISDPLIYSPSEGVDHSGYLTHQPTLRQVSKWLGVNETPLPTG